MILDNSAQKELQVICDLVFRIEIMQDILHSYIFKV
jgi:hypothetical protein